MINKSPDEYYDIISRMLLAAGASDENTEIVARHLVASEVAGVETHGVRPIARYFRDIKEGQLLPAATPSILEETDTSALVSGSWTFGQVGGEFAINLAIEKANASNIAIVSMVQAHHTGRVGHYAELAAAAGMVGIVAGSGYCKDARRTAPYGGRETLLDTNPISMAFPNPNEPDQRPVLLDYATTFKAQGALHLMKMRGQPAPPGFVIDKDGNPSCDAEQLSQGGAMLPFGSHKGYALMMAIEYLGRIVSGADDHIDPARGADMFRHQGVTMIVFKADIFRSLESYASAALEMSQATRAVPPAPGFDAVLMPGDPEANARAEREQDVIPIADDIWAMLKEEANKLGVDI